MKMKEDEMLLYEAVAAALFMWINRTLQKDICLCSEMCT
jgi:hypothetical protein